MKKKIFLTILVIVLAVASIACGRENKAETKETEKKSESVNNDVEENESETESIESETVEPESEDEENNDEIVLKSELQYKIENGIEQLESGKYYDKEGKLIQTRSYNGWDYAFAVTKYEYDENGDCIKDIRKSYDDYDQLISNYWNDYTYSYNSDGKLLEKMVKGADEDEYRSFLAYEYDANGNCIKEDQGNGYMAYEYKYDTNNNCIEMIEYMRGSLGYRYKYEYDNKGNKIKERMYAKDELTWMGEYEYNDDNVVVYCKETNKGVIYESFYNESTGKLMKRITKADGYEQVDTHSYVFDGKQRIINDISYSFDEEIYRISYEYDENDNITKETKFLRIEGTEEFTVSYSYEMKYDSNGNILEEKYTEGNLGHRYAYEYYE